MRIPLPSIKWLLVMLSLACVVPSALLAVGLIASHYAQEREEMEEGAVSTARAVAATLDDKVWRIQRELAFVAQSPRLKAADYPALYREMQTAQRALQLTNLVLFSSTQQIVNTGVPYGNQPPKELPPMQAALLHRRPSVSGLFSSPLSHRPVVAVSVPAQSADGGNLALNANIDADQLLATLTRQNLPATWTAAIVDADGRFIARTHEHRRFIGTAVSPELRERSRSSTEAALRTSTAEGIPAVVAFHRAPVSNWTVTISIPASELNAPARRSLWMLLAGFIAVLALSVGIAWRLGMRIADSIDWLGSAARALSHRAGVPPRAAAFSEARELARSFQHAAANIADAHATIAAKAGRLKAILETSSDAIIGVGDDHRITLFNLAAERMFKTSREKARGMVLERFVPPNLQAGEVVHARCADGTSFPVEASISLVMENDKRVYTVMLRDVTDRERQREALLRSNMELQQYAFVASHDLRSPLRSLGAMLELLQTRYGSVVAEEGRELFGRCIRAVRHMDRLTADLLSYARMEHHVHPIFLVDMAEAAADAVDMLEACIRETQARVEVDRLPMVHGDRTLLVQLLQNLISNAMKYCRNRPPHVHVWAERGPHEWIVHVRDNGIGIEPQHLSHVFEPFKRLHTQQEIPGSGLGLAICKRIVGLHQGRLWCESTPGEGSLFSFSIPDTRRAT